MLIFVVKMKILLTGGTGLVGMALAQALLKKGHQVSFLSRKAQEIPNIEVFEWNVARNFINERALKEADVLVHLAGENVGDGKWNEDRKRFILESRTLTTRLLAERLKTVPNQIKTVICASGVGIYGLDTAEKVLSEESPTTTNDFLAKVTTLWEKEIQQIDNQRFRTIILRIGVVLAKQGGALEKMAQPVKMFVGAPLGSGKQYVSWLHIDDLVAIFVKAIEDNNLSGIYNAVSPQPATNEELMQTIGRVLKRPILPINVPEFVLQLIFGEMAQIVLGGNRVSSQKIEESGFRFQYPQLENALQNLLNT